MLQTIGSRVIIDRIGGIDEATKLFLPFDEPMGATTFTDRSFSARTVTTVGNSKIGAVEGIPAAGALLLDGAADVVTVPDSTDWAYGSANFSHEAHVKFLSAPVSDVITGQYHQSGNRGHIWRVSNTAMRFTFCTGAADGTTIEAPFVALVNRWYHLAVARYENTLLFFVDGLLIGAESCAGLTVPNVATSFSIGGIQDSGSAWIQCPHAYIKNVRISDVTRWTAPFVPPRRSYTR